MGKRAAALLALLIGSFLFTCIPALAIDRGSVTSSSVISKETVYYTVTVVCGDGGKAFPDGMNRMKAGSSRFFTFTPNPGFMVSDVTVNGASAGAVSGYRVSGLSGDITLEVFFEPVSAASPETSSQAEPTPGESASASEAASPDEDDNPNTGAG